MRSGSIWTGLPCVGSLVGGALLMLRLTPAGAAPVVATSGAAPGYVDDALCGDCHGSKQVAYQSVGMSQAFAAQRPERDVEDFAQPPFFHAASGQHLSVQRERARLVFRRWRESAEGTRLDLLEQDVDFVLGSGHHARTYLYRTPGGELYQLPLAWYAQERRFAMAPGFDRRDHEGVTRRVRRECLFCHSAYPDAPTGSDTRFAPQRFPAQLPDGLGCQRCHGPGQAHVRVARGRVPDLVAVRRAIVNPGRLPAERRDDVCYGCHLQPSVALPGVRRFARGDWSFRPGQALIDYLVPVDADYADEPGQARFEINHHAYRLRQSRCAQARPEGLGCLTCHDPHRKPAAEQRAAHYRAACRTCHAADACTRPAPTPTTSDPDPSDCVACHMPSRRPSDVVRVVMTDHLIQRHAGGHERLAERAERDPVITDVRPYGSGLQLPPALRELFRLLPLATSYGHGAATERLAELLPTTLPDEPEARLALAEAQIKTRRFDAAERTLQGLKTRPTGSSLDLQAEEWRALVEASQGRARAAIARLRALAARSALGPEAAFNLGLLLAGASETRNEAPAWFRKSLAQRPNFVLAWFHLGQALQRAGQLDEAERAWRRALALDPSHERSEAALARRLIDSGRAHAARQRLVLAVPLSARAEPLTALLREAEAALASGRPRDAPPR